MDGRADEDESARATPFVRVAGAANRPVRVEKFVVIPSKDF